VLDKRAERPTEAAVDAPLAPSEASGVGEGVAHADVAGAQVGGAAERGWAAPLQPPSTRRVLFGLRLLLLALLFIGALLVYRGAGPTPPAPLFVQRGLGALPEVERPEGELLRVFEAARPAALQIELRAEAHPVSGIPQGIGTGFFISPDGEVLTAYHVVDTTLSFARRGALEAVGPDGTRYGLELVGFDAYRDLAVLQADLESAGVTEVPSLPLARRALEVGSEVVAIGNSRGEFLAGRVGRVRRLDVRAARADFADGTSELTASLAPGDSGGPVLNRDGEVVGVVSYIAITAQPGRPPGLDTLPELELPEGHPEIAPERNRFPFLRLPQRQMTRAFASYAVPVSAESDLLAGLREGVQRDVPVIGFTLGVQGIGQSYDPRLFPDRVLGPRPGVVVGQVAPGSPAERAGLRSARQEEVYSDGALQALRPVADVIVSVDGESTPTYDALTSVIRRRAIGQTVELDVQRGEERLLLPLELGARRAVFGQ
jgi:serine protease Do